MNYGKPNQAATMGELYPLTEEEIADIARSLVDALNAKTLVMAAYKASMAAYKAQLKEMSAAIESALQRANNAGIGTSIDELAASYLFKGDDDEV